jgi:hypothetical protein
MNWGAWLGLAVVFAVLMLVVQRTESKRRRAAALVMLVIGELVRRYLMYRGWPVEGFWAFWLRWYLTCVLATVGRGHRAQ